MADSLELRDGASEPGSDFELFAASLRASSGDLKTFIEVFADKLERALPGRAVVKRHGVRRFSREKRVARIELSLGDSRYIAVAQSGALETRCAKAVRGVVLKSEIVPLDAWLQALGADLTAEAEASEHSRLALEQLLDGS